MGLGLGLGLSESESGSGSDSRGSADHRPQSDAQLASRRRGAAITNSGNAPLAGIDPITILDRYEAGERIPEIARDLGCSQQAVYRYLLARVPEAWADYQAAHALDEHQRWIDRIESAPDALELARAREMVRSGQWQLERLLRRLYGSQAEPQQQSVVSISINLSDAAAHTVQPIDSGSPDSDVE